MKRRVAVVGAGPGGYIAAIRAAQLGADVTLVERDRMGGVCLHWGCIPSKIMKTAADLLRQTKRAAEFGLCVGDVRLEPARLAERRSRIIAFHAAGIEGLLQRSGVRVVTGRAAWGGARGLAVQRPDGAAEFLPWDRLIVAPGSRPLAIPSLPFDGIRIISSDEALHLTEIPGRLAIVGGGVIGCELACIFAAFGSRVTVIEARERLLPLPSVDEDGSKTLLREMKKSGIAVLLNATAGGTEPVDGGIRLSIASTGDGAKDPSTSRLPPVLEADRVLVCIGRRPNTEGLGLAEAGVRQDSHGWVCAGTCLETDHPNVYAVGDILGPDRCMLAHVASREGLLAAENAMGGRREMTYDAVPGAAFTMPEVAGVGWTETQARSLCAHVRTDTVLFRSTGKAHVIGELAGSVKIVSDGGSGRILGVHIVGAHATELIAEAVLALRQGATAGDIADTIHAHPTLAEVLYETALKATDRPLHG